MKAAVNAVQGEPDTFDFRIYLQEKGLHCLT